MMQIKLIRDDLKVSGLPFDESRMVRRNKSTYWKSGALIEANERECYLLVFNGDAEPADELSESICTGWRINREAVLLAREMLAKGIDPDDREKYKRGEILGYDEYGDYIPGPNYEYSDEELEWHS